MHTDHFDELIYENAVSHFIGDGLLMYKRYPIISPLYQLVKQNIIAIFEHPV